MSFDRGCSGDECLEDGFLEDDCFGAEEVRGERGDNGKGVAWLLRLVL